MKKSISIIFLFIGLIVNAQWDGTYNTKFGVVKLIQEAGNSSNSHQQIVYGDYGQNGTMIGKVLNQGRELHGTFHNGSQSGSFIWRKVGVGDPINIRNFSGFWGYGTQNNDYSNNEEHKWNGEQTQRIRPTDINNAIWSGKWNTNFGELIFEQVGTKVTGKYLYNGRVSEIDANYNKHSKILVGTYVENGKTVYFQFNLNNDGNSYSGKWGMTSAMSDPRPWNGTKTVKTNKSVGSSSSNTTNQNTSSTTTTQSALSQNSHSTNTASETMLTLSFDSLKSDGDIYGLWGVKLYRVTPNSRTLVSSFGNKSELVFNEKRESSKIIKSKFIEFSGPQHSRQFILKNSDLQNPNVKFELEVIVDPISKSAIMIDRDIKYGRKKEVYEINHVDYAKIFREIKCKHQKTGQIIPDWATFKLTIDRRPHL